MNYYNEHDLKAAAWLHELIKEGLIPNGHVDTRSIADVRADELAGFIQCHFFAGIGGWSLALQLAGWPADRPVWTGSCPCQPFSCAGKQLGDKDERHLWPAFFRLIEQCRPEFVFGEQVANAIGKGWLDGISADMEGAGYACGATVLGAHSVGQEADVDIIDEFTGEVVYTGKGVVGAPHIRQRLYWVAHAICGRRAARCASEPGQESGRLLTEQSSGVDGVAHTKRDTGIAGRLTDQPGESIGAAATGARDESGRCSVLGRVADTDGRNTSTEWQQRSGEHGCQPANSGIGGMADTADIRRAQHGNESRERGAQGPNHSTECAGVSGLANTPSGGQRIDGGAPGHAGHSDQRSEDYRLGHSIQPGLEGHAGDGDDRDQSRRFGAETAGSVAETGGVGAWSDYRIIHCLDGKARRIGTGIQPLAHGVPGRVGLLRGYGNAIVPAVAAEFIQAANEAITEHTQ